jgi:hypothetical protein
MSVFQSSKARKMRFHENAERRSMIWARMLAYITGTVDQELLLIAQKPFMSTKSRLSLQSRSRFPTGRLSWHGRCFDPSIMILMPEYLYPSAICGTCSF